MGCAKPVDKEKIRKRMVKIRKKYFLNMVVVVG
jgi:hypothetical protein